MERKCSKDYVAVGLALLVFCSVLSKLFVALRLEINWDEFLFLAHIYSAQAGDLSKVLQTGYVHLFSWIIHVPGNEINQIIIGRLTMWVAHCGTLLMLFLLGRDLFGSRAALFSVLAYSSFSYVTLYATSFRADPLVGFLIISASYLIFSRYPTPKMIIVTSLLMATATLISIKTVLFVPMLAFLALSRLIGRHDLWRMMTAYSILAACTVFSFLVIYMIHWHLMIPGPKSEVAGNLARTYDFVIRLDQPFPQWSYFEKTFSYTDPFYYLSIVIGFVFFVSGDYFHSKRKLLLVLVAIAYPLLILVFYRNTFPYFYPLVLAIPSLLAGFLWNGCVGGTRSRAASLMPIIVIGIFCFQIFRDAFHKPLALDQHYQRQVVEVVHKMFPNPVSYIDGNSMISSFPKSGFFMSTWGLTNYLDAGVPVITNEIRNFQPKFLLKNTSSDAFVQPLDSQDPWLLREDALTVSDNFIHHWGPIWIAGIKIDFPANIDWPIDILVAGFYTLEAKHAIYVDGVLVYPGDHVELEKTQVVLRSPFEDIDIILRYGKDIYRPEFDPLSDKVYQGFK